MRFCIEPGFRYGYSPISLSGAGNAPDISRRKLSMLMMKSIAQNMWSPFLGHSLNNNDRGMVRLIRFSKRYTGYGKAITKVPGVLLC